jgi:hypothetical protein
MALALASPFSSTASPTALHKICVPRDLDVGELLVALRAAPEIRITRDDRPESAVAAGRADACVVPHGAENAVRVLFDPSTGESREARFSAEAAIERHNVRVIYHEFVAVDERPIPGSITVRGRAIRVSAAVGPAKTLATLFVISMLRFAPVAAQNVAREKDRRTSEALLALPLVDSAVVLGKALFVASAATISGVGAAAFVAGASKVPHSGASVPLTLSSLCTTAFVLAGLASLFASAGVLVGVYAKSAAEASVYAFIVVIPIAVIGAIFLASQSAPLVVRLVPVIGALFALRDASVDSSAVWVSATMLLTTAGLSAVLVGVAARKLRNETFVLRATN